MNYLRTTPERLRGLAWELEQRNPRPRTSDSTMLRAAAEEIERLTKRVEELEARPSTIVNEVRVTKAHDNVVIRMSHDSAKKLAAIVGELPPDGVSVDLWEALEELGLTL